MQKIRIFHNLWCVRTDKEGLSQFGERGGVNLFFAILCGRLLWTAAKLNLHNS